MELRKGLEMVMMLGQQIALRKVFQKAEKRMPELMELLKACSMGLWLVAKMEIEMAEVLVSVLEEYLGYWTTLGCLMAVVLE